MKILAMICGLLLAAGTGWCQTYTNANVINGAVQVNIANMPIYRQTVTVTNEPAQDDLLDVDGVMWTWKTNASAARDILLTAGDSNNRNATNLFAGLTNSAPANVTATISGTNSVLLTGTAGITMSAAVSNGWGTVVNAATNASDGIVSIPVDSNDKFVIIKNLSTNRVYYTIGGTNGLVLLNTDSLDATGGNRDTIRLEAIRRTIWLLGTTAVSNKVTFIKELR